MSANSGVTSAVPDIQWEPIAHNFGSRDRAISAIVIHITTARQDPRAWFDNPLAQASATYCVMKDGRINQYLAESVKAWHAGIPSALRDPRYSGSNKPVWPGLIPWADPNGYSIGIENALTTSDVWPEPLLESLTTLMADIAHRYEFPIDELHVARHHDIWAGHSCPGPLCPFDEIVSRAASKLADLRPLPPVAAR